MTRKQRGAKCLQLFCIVMMPPCWIIVCKWSKSHHLQKPMFFLILSSQLTTPKSSRVELSWDEALCLFSRPNYFLTQPLSPTHSPSSVSLRFNPPVPTATACFRGNYKVLLVFLLHRPQRVPQARECSCVVSLCMAIRTICLIMFLETGYQFVLYSSLSKFWGDISESTRRC